MNTVTICQATILLFTVLLVLKNGNTFHQREAVIKAIFTHKIMSAMRREDFIVDYIDMESYGRTLWRLFDWGSSNIVHDKKKYQILVQHGLLKGKQLDE